MGSLFSIVVGILNIIAKYKLFEKSGEQGWKAIVPFYSKITFCKLYTGKKGVALASAIFISLFLTFIVTAIADESMYFLIFLCLLVYAVLNIKSFLDLGKSFRKDRGFLSGLAILPNIFTPILGFGNDRYYGPQGKSDYLDYNMYGTSPDPNQYIGMNNTGNEYNASAFQGGYQNNQGYAYQNAPSNGYQNNSQMYGNGYNQPYGSYGNDPWGQNQNLNGQIRNSPYMNNNDPWFQNGNTYSQQNSQWPQGNNNDNQQNNQWAYNNNGYAQNQPSGNYGQRPNQSDYSNNQRTSDNPDSNTINKYYQSYDRNNY